MAHWPGSGVNVYVPLFVLLTTAGLQLPVIPFDEVFGNVGTASPTQIVALLPKVNVGVMIGFIVTVNVVPVIHPVTLGVNT